MKKFAKVIACFMLVVLATLGFAGCSKTINLSSEDAIDFIGSQGNGLEMGYEYVFEYDDYFESRKALFDNDGNLLKAYAKRVDESRNIDVEVWMNGRYVCLKDNAEETPVKVKAKLDSIPEDSEYTDKLKMFSADTFAEIKEYGNNVWLSEFLSDELMYVDEHKFTKTTKGKKTILELKTHYVKHDDFTEEVETFDDTYTIVFKNKKITEYKLIESDEYEGDTRIYFNRIKAFSGKIQTPTYDNSFEDVSVEL